MPKADWYHPIDFADVKALRRVSLEARWVFVETFCGELGEKSGLVQCRPVLIAAECGIPVAKVELALAELASSGLIVWCKDARTAYHVGSIKRHPPMNPKHRTGWERDIRGFDDCAPRSAAQAELDGRDADIPQNNRSVGYSIDTVSEGYGYPFAQEQEQEQEQEQNILVLADAAPKEAKKPRKQKAAFAPPTLEDTRDYFRSLGLGEHELRVADNCFDYWLSAGWKRKSGPIVDWHATCRTWLRNERERNPVKPVKQAANTPDFFADGTPWSEAEAARRDAIMRARFRGHDA